MTVPPLYLAAAAAWLALLVIADRVLRGERRAAFRHVAVVTSVVLGFLAQQRLVRGELDGVSALRVGVAALAIACIAWERRRARQGRPISPAIRQKAGIALGVAGFAAYWAGAVYGYPRFFHVWDQYHYFVGGRYFPELGYDELYRCTAVAQDELGVVRFTDAAGREQALDLRAEVREPTWKIRNLGRDNLLVSAAGALADPGACRRRFSSARWEAFKADVAFFRLAAGWTQWQQIQRDHGFNPPPVWLVTGLPLASLSPASTPYLVFLASLDVLLLAGTFAALGWAFGWRVAALGAVFWGGQAFSTFYWTGGAFLRQDWLFLLVLSACLARRRKHALAGAALAWAGLLRVFPLLFAFGWLVIAVAHWARRGRPERAHLRLLAGGLLAAALLVPASLAVAGRDAYAGFYRHTLQVHDRTPLTNHVGLRPLLSHGVGTGPGSGRMRYTRDDRLTDPFQVWKRMRLQRWERNRPLGWALAAASLLWLAWVLRRIRSSWMVLCLSQLVVVLGAQLTTYYYSFLVLSAPLTRVRRQLEVPLLGLAVVSQFVAVGLGWIDDRFAALSLLALLFCWFQVWSFARWKRRRSGAGGPLPARRLATLPRSGGG